MSQYMLTQSSATWKQSSAPSASTFASTYMSSSFSYFALAFTLAQSKVVRSKHISDSFTGLKGLFYYIVVCQYLNPLKRDLGNPGAFLT